MLLIPLDNKVRFMCEQSKGQIMYPLLQPFQKLYMAGVICR